MQPLFQGKKKYLLSIVRNTEELHMLSLKPNLYKRDYWLKSPTGPRAVFAQRFVQLQGNKY